MAEQQYSAPESVTRLEQRAFVVGAVALGLAALGALRSPETFYPSYLMSFLLVLGLALGSLGLVMLQHLTSGHWGIIIRRPLESATRTLPLLVVLFLPIAISGMKHLYRAWLDPEELHKEPLSKFQQGYLTHNGYLVRALIYFAVWLALMFIFNGLSKQQDTNREDRALRRRLKMLAGTEPFSTVLKARHLHDLGKLLLAFVMLWAYFDFSQLLIIWSGNLPEEITFYRTRLYGEWGVVAVIVLVFHFFVPFFLLLSQDLKRNRKVLPRIAMWLILMRLVDLFWMTRPEFTSRAVPTWLDLLLPIALGGLWLGFFAFNLKQCPLLPLGDPGLAEAIKHHEH